MIGAYGLGSCQYNCLNRGDINHSGGDSPIGISDLTYFVDYLFNEGPMPISYEEGDINSDGTHSISDLTFLVDYLFNNGATPVSCSK